MGLLDFISDKQAQADMRQGTTDALNRGIVASALGAPADMGGLLLNAIKAAYGYAGHKAGLLSAADMPEMTEPRFGSEWWGRKMQDAGMVSANRNPVAETLAGGLLAPAVSANAPAIAANLVKHGDQFKAYNKALGPAGASQATVWHGSPHKFDKFDSSKIGTGEGAQAYGHGLYLAEAKGVADEYAGKLSKKVIDFAKKDPTTAAERRLAKSLESLANDTQYGGGASVVGDAYRSIANPMRDALYGNSFVGIPPLSPRKLGERLVMQRAANRLGAPSVGDDGALYKVDLPDNMIARMLDWDRPLSQQAPEVQAAMRRAYAELGLADPFAAKTPKTGEYAMRDIAAGFSLQKPDAAAASGYLRELGIPGVRYLDGGSRGAGSGTSNFVVFPGEENLLTILERNGAPIGKP